MSVFQSLNDCPSFLYLARLSFSVELTVTSLPPYCHELLISGRDVSAIHRLFPSFSERCGKSSKLPSSSISSRPATEPITWYESLNQLRSSTPSSLDLFHPHHLHHLCLLRPFTPTQCFRRCQIIFPLLPLRLCQVIFFVVGILLKFGIAPMCRTIALPKRSPTLLNLLLSGSFLRDSLLSLKPAPNPPAL